MKIFIKSRKEIEAIYSKDGLSQKTAVISITDYECDFAYLKNKPTFLLQLDFDDVDNDVIVDEVGKNPTIEQIKLIEEKYHMFSEQQALEIASFYFKVCNEAEIVICQCEHGQSRSAAVAAAILEFTCKKGINIFSDDRYYPNKVVFRKTLNALKKLDSEMDGYV